MEPIDLTTYPEVFEPEETDQVAKYLNQQRPLLEEFCQSPLPVPPMPLLPPAVPLDDQQVAARRERARTFSDWSVKGVLNRERWVITPEEFESIKAEVGSLRRYAKAAASPKISVMYSKLSEDLGMEEPLLTRTSIKKMPRFHLRVEDMKSMGRGTADGIPQSRPMLNTCQTFAEVKKKFGPVQIAVDDEVDTPFKLPRTVTVAETW